MAVEAGLIPALEKASGKQWKCDFNVGYSPERINPGDKSHTLRSIVLNRDAVARLGLRLWRL